jgi:hypothetical protein
MKTLQEQIDEIKQRSQLNGLRDGNINSRVVSDQVIRARELNGWKEKNEARYKDEEYSKKVGNKISQAYSTAEGREKQRLKSKPHKDEAKEKIRQARLGTKRTAATKQKLSEKRKGNTNRCKRINTPQGQFESKKLAVEHYFALGQANAGKWLDKQLQIDSDQFYFMDKAGNKMPLEKQNKSKN